MMRGLSKCYSSSSCVQFITTFVTFYHYKYTLYVHLTEKYKPPHGQHPAYLCVLLQSYTPARARVGSLEAST